MTQKLDPKLKHRLDKDISHAVTNNRIVGLWRLMDGFHWLYGGAMVAIALAALIRSLGYRLVQKIVDQVFEQGLYQNALPWLALTFVGLAALEGVFVYLRSIWSAQTAEGITLRLRNYIYDHLQRLPFTFHDYVKTGELIQRATSDVSALRRFFADQAVGIGRILALFTVNLAMVLSMNWKLGLLSIVILPFIVGLSLFFFGRVSKAYKSYQEQEARLSTTLQENLSGVRVVRAFARQDYEKDKFNLENWEKYQRGKRLILMHSLYWPLSDILCAAQRLLVIAVGASMTMRGEITVGTYIAAMAMVTWIILPMRNLGRLIVQVSTGLVSYNRVMAVLAHPREDIEGGSVPEDTVIRGAISFEDVSFSYEPELILSDSPDKPAATPAEGTPSPVLHHVTFQCEPGSVVALLGSTGSGKTSIINLLLRFYNTSSGRILLDGRPLETYPRTLLRRQIGIVEQEPFLFSRSIRDNIAYGAQRPVTQAEIEAAARAAAIHDIISTFPQGYDTIVGEKGVTLSGGQRQRVAIARALLKDPRILVLDDATSSVDTETEDVIRQALARLIPGRTTFIIAHRIQSVMNADLILVLDHGRIVQSGTHAELMAQAGPYRQIYEIQSRVTADIEEAQ